MQSTTIQTYLTSLWLKSKEITIYTTLYSLWKNPASSIARACNLERVYTYKALQKFVSMGITAQTQSKGVKQFWIPSLDLLQKYIEQQAQQRQSLNNEFETIQQEFLSLETHRTTAPPRIQLYEWNAPLGNLFQDIQTTISTNDLLQIKLFATNTFSEQLGSREHIIKHSKGLFWFLERTRTTLHSYVAEWELIMQHLRTHNSLEVLWELPAWDHAINLRVVGKQVYIIIYKDQPIGLKIESPELAWALHFLLEQFDNTDKKEV